MSDNIYENTEPVLRCCTCKKVVPYLTNKKCLSCDNDSQYRARRSMSSSEEIKDEIAKMLHRIDQLSIVLEKRGKR